MGTGNGEQNAAALPFCAEVVIGHRARAGDRDRGTGNGRKQCYNSEHSLPSRDEFHDMAPGSEARPLFC
jgi:hypothetical protein